MRRNSALFSYTRHVTFHPPSRQVAGHPDLASRLVAEFTLMSLMIRMAGVA